MAEEYKYTTETQCSAINWALNPQTTWERHESSLILSSITSIQYNAMRLKFQWIVLLKDKSKILGQYTVLAIKAWITQYTVSFLTQPQGSINESTPSASPKLGKWETSVRKDIRRKIIAKSNMQILSKIFTSHRSGPGLTMTTSAADQQGVGGNCATIGQRQKRGRKGKKRMLVTEWDGGRLSTVVTPAEIGQKDMQYYFHRHVFQEWLTGQDWKVRRTSVDVVHFPATSN